MRRVLKTYIALVCGGWSILVGATPVRAQGTTAGNANQPSCAAVLANDSTVGTRVGPGDSTSTQLTSSGFQVKPNGVVAKCPSKYEAAAGS